MKRIGDGVIRDEVESGFSVIYVEQLLDGFPGHALTFMPFKERSF